MKLTNGKVRQYGWHVKSEFNWCFFIEMIKNAHHKPWKQCIRILYSLGVNKQENMQVNNKCTLLIDPDTHMKGDPRILASSLHCAFGVVQVKVTGSSPGCLLWYWHWLTPHRHIGRGNSHYLSFMVGTHFKYWSSNNLAWKGILFPFYEYANWGAPVGLPKVTQLGQDGKMEIGRERVLISRIF